MGIEVGSCDEQHEYDKYYIIISPDSPESPSILSHNSVDLLMYMYVVQFSFSGMLLGVILDT